MFNVRRVCIALALQDSNKENKAPDDEQEAYKGPPWALLQSLGFKVCNSH